MQRLLFHSLLLAFLLPAVGLFAQLNVEYAGQLEYDHRINDIWGYQSPEGIEYALVGTEKGFSIISLENPAEPREESFIRGKMSTWRDVKTWDHYAYVCTDNADQGILIVDLSTINADTVTWQLYTPLIPDAGFLFDAHNIYIDEKGRLFLAGSERNNGGIVILDLTTDPWAPSLLGLGPAVYAHDVYARNDVMYASEIYAGTLSLYDVSDPTDVKFLGSTETPFRFTHNAWPSDDGSTVFTTDERANAWVGAYDITEYDNIKELDLFKPAATSGEGVIPHNVHVLNDYLVISYYTDGVIIVDASRPGNLIEVGNYDTFLGGHGGFSGAWGAYPFLPSGIALVTDRSNGLFILTPNYVRGCYLEGVVKDISNNEPIFQAEIRILGEEAVLPELSGFNGSFKTGKAIPGSYMVEVSAPGYHTLTRNVEFENGVVTEKEFLLTPKDKYNLNGVVRSLTNQAPAPNAHVYLRDADFRYETTADENGNFSLTEIYEGEYEVYAGTWGEFFIGNITIDENENDEIVISPGYYDDFNFAFDWTVTGNTDRGQWVRDIPNRQLLFDFYECNPAEDVEEDFGNKAFITGNMGNNAASDDPDLGYTMLSSPPMDLRIFADPKLSFRPWLCQLFEDVTTYTILISNGEDFFPIDTISRTTIAGDWRDPHEYFIADHMTPGEQIQIHFLVTDTVVAATENVVKAGLDLFMVTGELKTSFSDPNPDEGVLQVYPNPFGHSFTVELLGFSTRNHYNYELYDVLGRLIVSGHFGKDSETIALNKMHGNGLYILKVMENDRLFSTVKLMKQGD